MVSYSNYTYEPSLSSRPGAGKPLIENASVAAALGQKLATILEDIALVQDRYGPAWAPRQRGIHHASYFGSALPPGSVSLLVTSPPYMNNYHYVRNTRPQLHWLDLLDHGASTRALEEASFGKFWQTVRQGPTIDLTFELPELDHPIAHLRTLNPQKGPYGGAGWANYVATYFNDTNRFLALARCHLRPGAHALIVVGNSIIQGIEFKLDQLLAQLAERHALTVADIRTIRAKRVGTSIIDSSVRISDPTGPRQPTQLYDAALILRA
jgi:hypothetical protein